MIDKEDGNLLIWLVADIDRAMNADNQLVPVDARRRVQDNPRT